jgi:glycosyltransferase involved in cell wall biosynthesis
MKLSVVVPAHNRATLLPVTLRSLLAQQRVADEILLVDDGSSDGTAEIAEAFGHPVRVIRQRNQGPSAARNRGLAESQGEFIHFFDSDDLALPNLHAVQLQALEQANADIAYSPWLKCRLDPHLGVKPTNHILQACGLPHGSLVRALLTNWSTVPISWLVRRSCLEKAGGFPEDLCCAEDQLLFLSLLLAGANVLHTPSTLVLYRDDGHQTLSRPSNKSAQRRQTHDWAQFLIRARSLCLDQGIDPDSWFGFRRRAYLAWQALGQKSNSSPELMQQLKESFRSIRLPDQSYALSRSLQQKGEGITARLLGRRAHRSFRSAPLSASSQQFCSQHLMKLCS